MPLEWSNEKVLGFLELYASERIIWDPSHRNHKLKHKVHDAWKRISINFDNCSIETLKRKKKSLMATFRPLLKKKKVSMSGEGSDDVVQPMWFAYGFMESFLGSLYDVEDTINTKDEPQQEPPPLLSTNMRSTSNTNTKNSDREVAEKNTNDSFNTLSEVLKRKEDEDECDLYAKLLAIKLRKYPEAMRQKIMYKIDGFLLDNPFPSS